MGEVLQERVHDIVGRLVTLRRVVVLDYVDTMISE